MRKVSVFAATVSLCISFFIFSSWNCTGARVGADLPMQALAPPMGICVHSQLQPLGFCTCVSIFFSFFCLQEI